jgi:Outer membrane protein beta-barrel domain
MRKYVLAMLAATLAFAPLAASAEGPSYSFVEAGYIVTDIDDFDDEFDGFGLGGSFEFVENWFVYASYLDQSAEIFDVDVDSTGFDVGFGYAFPLTETMDLYGKLGYTEVEIEAFDESVDDDGYALGLGLRAIVIEQLELEGSINYVDLSDSGDDTAFGLAARWYFLPQFALGLEGAFSDDANSYGVSARWEFGRQ